MKLIIGIDPGITGAIVQLDAQGKLVRALRTPTLAGNFDLNGMRESLKWLGMRGDYAPNDVVVAFEKVGQHFIGGSRSSGKTMFAFGRGAGLWEALIFALGHQRIDVDPRTWQRLLLGMPQVARESYPTPEKYSSARREQGKRNAVARAMQFWPELPIKHKADWGMADAALIAETARRQLAGMSVIV